MKRKTLFFLSILLIILTLGIIFSGCTQELSSPRDLCIDNGVFRWSKVEGADGYLVYFNDEETSRFFTWYNYLDMGNENIQSSLKSGQVNYLWVRAITLDDYGEPDIKSDRSRLDFGYSRKVDAPTKLKYVSENNTLQWRESVDEGVTYIAVLNLNGETKEIELKYSQAAVAIKASLDNFPSGTYSLYVIARKEGYEDSDPTNSVEVTVDESADYPVDSAWTVTFDLNYEGSKAFTLEAEKGRSVSRPEDPTRVGYTFDGWYFDSYCLIEAGFTSKNSKFNVTAPTTIYAKWTKVVVKTTPVFVYMENCEELSLDIYQGDNLLEEGISFSKVSGKENWFKANINELTTAIVLDNGTKTDKIAFDKASPYYKDGKWLTEYPIDITPSSFVTVTINGSQVIGLKENKTPEASNVTSEYYGSFTLSANDYIVIKNTDGLEYINYEADCGFNGVAPYDGEYTVYAKIYDDGGHSVWVTMPEAPVYDNRVVYFYNYGNWSSVSAYSWISDAVNNAAWPGVKMTKVDGHDGWYSLTVSGSFSNIIFNNGSSDKQTDDLIIDSEKPYFNGYEWTDGFNTFDRPVYEDRTVYFYNYKNWSSVSAYAWAKYDGKLYNQAFPGVKMAKVDGHDGWYSVTVSGDYDMVIFNDSVNNSNNKTANLVIDNEKPYFNGYEWTDDFNVYSGPDYITVYFYNSANWAKVYAYTWPKGGSNTNWPGEVMEKVDGHDGWYMIKVDLSYNMIIFNVGSDATKTLDIDMPSGTTLYYNYATGKWQSSF